MTAVLEAIKSKVIPFVETNPYVLPVTKLLFGLSDAYPGPIPEVDEIKANQGWDKNNYSKRVNWILFPIYLGPAWIPWAYKLYKMYQSPQPPKFEIKTNIEWIGLGMSLIGAVIRVFSRLWMRRQFTYFISIRQDHKLVTNGPYSIVRHPGYTGFFLWYIGDAMYYGNYMAYLYALQIVITIIIKIPKEEQVLSDAFGKEYKAYCDKVRAKLIPFLY